MQETEFLKYLVENLVENKDDIVIERTEDDFGILLTLKVNKDDMGIIIGKSGNTVNSLRTLLRLVGVKIDKKINLKVLD